LQEPPDILDRVEREGAPGDPAGAPNRLERYERWVRTLDHHVRVLEAERRKYTALLHHTEVAFLTLDTASRVTWINANFERRLTKTNPGKDPVGLTCNQVLCRKPAPCPDCPAAAAIRSGQAATHEITGFLRDGFHLLHASAAPVHDAQGSVDQAIVMLQDLSGLKFLKRSEEALRTTEQRYRSIFEQAAAGMVTIRADGSFLQVNPRFCSMLGYSESKLLRMKLAEVVHFGHQEEVEGWLKAAQAGTIRQVEAEYRFVRNDMNFLWCHCTSVWQFDDKRRPTHSVMLIHDITERKQAEIELDQSRRRYQALVHSIDGIVWEGDASALHFTFVSNQALKILGYPLERWIEQPRFWRNHMHPQDLEGVDQALGHAVAAQRSAEIEYRMLAADGREVWVRDAISVVVEGGKVVKLRGLMIDVTKRKADERALRQSEEQLRQAQKMEAIGRLAGGIAHDFNNLLTAITGYGDLLLKKLGEEHPQRREALEISKAAQRAAALTGQLLAFSRQQVLQPKVIDLNDVIEDMEMMLRRLIGEHIELVTHHGACQGAVKADPGQIHQVLLNLVVNARDAMSEGGTLTIETADVDITELDAAAPEVGLGAWILLAVRDTGCGMDEQTKARLFEPFFTTKEQGKGTGLGLSTVYGIVTQSGGHIACESRPGAGTTFRIHLPRVPKVEVEAPPPKEAEVEAAPGTEAILLVEDDDSVRELAREILQMNGYSVIEATNGVEALRLFEADPDRIDLMVTDLVMPQMGGRDLAQRVAPVRPELRVLYLSGYTDSVAIQQGILDAGSFFLQKPFTPADLARKVRDALDS